MRARTSVLLVLSLLALTASLRPVLRACCMVPRSYAGDVDQSAQHVLVLHHDGHEELVLRVRPFFRGADAPPSSLAWLVTVPSVPTAYRTASPEVFAAARSLHEKLRDLYEEQEPNPLVPNQLSKGLFMAADAAPRSAISIGATITVGPYEITPITALGASAVDELNRYLGENGFGEEEPDHLRWFAENEFTFLCIKITPPEGSTRLGDHLDLPPLQIGFDSERPYYPGMYSANQGDFGLELTMLSSKPISRRSVQDIGNCLRAVSSTPNLFTVKPLPEAFGSAVERAVSEDSDAPERWYLNRYDSYGVNPTLSDGRPAISDWTEDIRWELGGAADLPPDWYYGDGSRPLTHPNNLRTLLYVAVMASVLGLLLLFLRRRRAPPVEQGPRVE